MKFLKGLALALLIFLLFQSLSIFGLALTLNNTILDPDFVVSELARLDISSLAKEFKEFIVDEQLTPEEELMAEVIGDTIAERETWIKEQVRYSIYTSYDYFLGRSQSLSLVISLEPLTNSLRNNMLQALLESLPPELVGAPSAEVELYINQHIDEILTKFQIPPTFEFNVATLTPEVQAQLEQARQYVGYFQQLGYKILIGFILFLILGIILIHRQVKGATRGIGITFLYCGVPWYASIFAAKYLAGTQLELLPIPTQLQEWLELLPPIPTQLQEWLPQFLNNFLAPLQMFSLSLVIGGVVLIVVSFVYPRWRQSSS